MKNLGLVLVTSLFFGGQALACEDHGTQSSTTRSAASVMVAANSTKDDAKAVAAQKTEEHACKHADGKSCMHDGGKCDHGDGKSCKEGGCEYCAKGHADGKHSCPHCSGKGHAHGEKVDAKSDEKSEFRQKIDGQLDRIETQIAELKTKSSTMSAEAKAGMETRIAKLEKNRDEIKADLSKMGDSSGRAWTKFKKGVSKAVDNLEAGFKEAKNELDSKTKN